MKFKFNFELSAESGKVAANDFSAELGKINCPITVEVELEAAEVQQTLGLMKEIIAKVPSFIKEAHEHEMELAERRAKLEADNIRLRADLAENASKMAHTRAVDLVRLKAEIENHDSAVEPEPVGTPAEPDRATGSRKHSKI